MSGQYFEPDPIAASQSRTITVPLPSGSVDLLTDRGVFSPQRLDTGTSVLLRGLGDLSALPDLPIVDLGCGYGPIVCELAQAYPDREFWAVDVNRRARELCAENVANLGFNDRVRVLEPEEIPTEKIAGVISNPPIRIGKSALHELLECWLTAMDSEGESWLVVQKHLGADSLTSWLTDQGWPTTKESSKKGFRVLRVSSTG